jgi:MFS family permease
VVIPSTSRLSVRAGVLGSAYVLQGLVYGFTAFILIPTLAQRGVSLEAQTGLLALAGLPWVLKIAWGPVVDGLWSTRRSPGAIAAIATFVLAVCAAVIAVELGGEVDFAMLAFVWLALNVALALQDVATDALAFDVLEAHERGRGQAAMLLGHHLGQEAGAGVWLSGVAATHGLGAPMWIVAVVAIGLASLPLVLAKSSAPRTRAPVLQVAVDTLRDRRVRWALVLAALVLVADVSTSALAGAFWIDRLRWRAEDFGIFVAPFLLLGNIAGYGLAWVVVDRLSHRRAAAVASAGLGACWIAFAVAEPLWGSEGFLAGFIVVQAIATALLLGGVHALLMDVLDPRVRGTQYAICTACLNLPRVWAPLVAPALLAGLGFAGVFVACGVYQVAIVVLVLAVRPRAAADGRVIPS